MGENIAGGLGFEAQDELEEFWLVLCLSASSMML